jgi:hypothetical protein
VDNIASIGIQLSYVLIQFLLLGYEFMEQHQVCIDTHCRYMYFGTDDRSTLFFKPALPTPRANDPSPITAAASPLAERSDKKFCVELCSKVRRLLDEFESLFDMVDASTMMTAIKQHICLKNATPAR